MRHKTAFNLMPMLILMLFALPLSAQEFEFNWAPGGNSLQWTDSTNLNGEDEDGPTPGGSEAIANIGAGSLRT